MGDLFDAIHERRARAIEVKATYTKTDVGSNCFVVTHPDDPERTYVVDLVKLDCTCPDMQCTAKPAGFFCKHVLAVAEGEQVALPEPKEPSMLTHGADPESEKFSVAMAEFDNDNPWKD